ncbi:MAG TPA: malto-oligosyltrehalose trehalohydrolase [Gemmatimonadales bacterium]|nr:malto-oligosyltrehalose trehalohydrolase [Gemmatimonadales bacterium]
MPVTTTQGIRRRLPIGAEVAPSGGGVHFRVWAPKRQRVEVESDGAHTELEREESGYFSGLVPGLAAGSRYRFRLDGDRSVPDPVSRYQPDGPHGPSQVIDPSQFRWTDHAWRGIAPARHIVYELHIGTFTPQGTFAAAAERFADLVELGVKIVEVMPIAEFAGTFGWGYDGVDWFAPFHLYGSCDDFRALVDRAHAVGLGVILDVVYNHFGPDGNYVREFSDTYFSKHGTDWGEAINYQDPGCDGVRELVLSNVRHWIDEYHLDGLRLDATHAIHDDSPRHILFDIGVTARDAAGDRSVLVFAETEPQDARIVRAPEKQGYGLDYIWCDDFHHLAYVAATGRREAYYTDYGGTPQEFVSAVKRGPLYQGQFYKWQKQRRGGAAWDIPRWQMVFALENHDQVANSRDGRRLHQLTSPGRYRALTALLLLAPETPLLFQGQEFGATAPFLYFADHEPELRRLVRQGREEFLRQFASMTRGNLDDVPDPGDPATFARSRVDWSERDRNAAHLALHRDLIALKERDRVLSGGTREVDGAVLGPNAFAIRFFAMDGNDRLLVVNLGIDLPLDVAPEPLLAPPDRERGWTRLWHSEDPRYGGRGGPALESEVGSWRIPAESAALLVPNAK